MPQYGDKTLATEMTSKGVRIVPKEAASGKGRSGTGLVVILEHSIHVEQTQRADCLRVIVGYSRRTLLSKVGGVKTYWSELTSPRFRGVVVADVPHSARLALEVVHPCEADSPPPVLLDDGLLAYVALLARFETLAILHSR